MNFIKIKEVQELFKDEKHTLVETNISINLDNVLLIREINDNNTAGLSLSMIGRDKPIKVLDKNSIELIKKKCNIDMLNG